MARKNSIKKSFTYHQTLLADEKGETSMNSEKNAAIRSEVFKQELASSLLSKKVSTIKKVAKQIRRQRIEGLDQALAEALDFVMTKPRSWEAQHELILTIAATECISLIPYLEKLVQGNYSATVLYRSLALAIVYLQNKEKKELSYVYSILESGNQNLFAGALLGLNQREVVLSHEEVQDFYSAAKREVYLENFRQVISPIQVLVSTAFLFEDRERQELISYCQELNSAFFSSIITNLNKNKKIPYL